MPCSDDCGLSGDKGWQGKFLYGLDSVGKRDIDFRRADMANMNGEEKKRKKTQQEKVAWTVLICA